MEYQQLLVSLYGTFPRDLSLPERTKINSMDELMQAIDQNNGKKRVFVSVYQAVPNPPLDKVWFDFDGPTAFDNMLKLHAYLLTHNYKHLVVMSGGGYHIYVKTTPVEGVDSRRVLRNAHLNLIQKAGIDVDKHIIGDTARVVTIPGTFNTKRGCFAITLSTDDLARGDAFIKEKAHETQLNGLTVFGSAELDLHEYAKGVGPAMDQDLVEFSEEELQAAIQEDAMIAKLEPCIVNMVMAIKSDKSSHRKRYLVIQRLLDKGLSPKMVESLMKKWLPPDKFYHMMVKERQISNVASKNNRLVFPSCETLKAEGLCPGECSSHGKWYK